jgi:uncharacterized protein (DUF305 family)
MCLLHPARADGATDAGSPVVDRLATPQEAYYLQHSAVAMQSMMQDMGRVPTGDVDRDFVAQMVPHHRGAIDMAIAILQCSHNTQLRRLAEEIIVTQRDEIAAMQLAVPETRLADRESRR